MNPKRRRIEAALLMGASALGVATGGMFLGTQGFSATSGTLLALGSVLLVRSVQRAGRSERVLVLGSGPLARRLLRAIEMAPDLRWDVRWLPETTTDDGDAISPSERMAQAIRVVAPDRIIVAFDERRGRLPVRTLLAERTRGVRIEEASSVFERLTGKVAIESLRPGELLFGDGFRASRLDRFVARAFSVGSALVALLLLAPVFPLVALAIRLDSKGPVFFRQARLGLWGKPFELVKFRTMHPIGGPHSEWERDNAARVTRVGRVLRKTHLDELPQLFNILAGDMNLVGPRPHPVVNADILAKRIPYYDLRLLVPPGLTGWAQVRYHYANDLDEEAQKMRYDLYYLKHRSFWLDLKVLPATLWAALGRKGVRPKTPDTATPVPWAGKVR